MKVTYDTEGDFRNTIEWLNKAEHMDAHKIANHIAKQGVQSLSNHTPKGTGETASGWKAKITREGDNYEVNWYNDSHPETTANVAILIDKGHGLRGGGYVPARPFIKKAMRPVWKETSNLIDKELK